ncbi:sushi, von Willebrand factor type A, EGF and pentraxin domain-containing protein 1-like [Saccostrea cucullata]|uniref:sushi, von Willebrand factor type A, EGF and pentraxin domain-containing protein 1-like n=1 Tax=Saccostrea cuccullata TaxID=36930 RepID=UPI002ED097A1
MDTCSFTIDVTATRCPELVLGDGVIRVCTDYDGRYGSRCEFECYYGYNLDGKRKTVCQNNGRWDSKPPICKEKRCPPLPKGKGLSYSCTKENKFQSECSLECPAGFDIPPGKGRVKLCRNDGQWKGSFPQCIDILKPRIENCKPFVDGTADINSTRGRIYWDEPGVYDNEDKDIILHKSVEISPGDVIEAGTRQVQYTAKDRTGNKATPCNVTLSMKTLTCQRLFDDTFLSVTCPWGYKYGGQCHFSCRIGSVLVGPNVTNCVKSKDGKYVYWDFGKTQPYCEVFRACANDPIPPKNGAVACDSWLDGKFCQVQCQEGYYFKPDYPFHEMLVCGDSGIWEPKEALPIPDCSKTYEVKVAKFQMHSSFYYDGDCTDPIVQEHIRQNYISSLSKSAFKEACIKYKSQCKIENVEVLCGATSRRKRSPKLEIVVDFVIDSENVQTEQGFVGIQSSMMNVLINESSNGSLSITLDDNVTLSANDLSAANVAFECPNNTFPSYTTSSCVECPAGTYYNPSLQTCPQCSKGHYQPLEGQPACLQCPTGTTTAQVGSKSARECLEACLPGYWSVTGVGPCSPCPRGFYADDYGTSVCTACPPSQTTLIEGSNNSTECTYFDIFLGSTESKASVDIDLTNEERKITLSAWLRLPPSFNKTIPSLLIQNNGRSLKTISIEQRNESNKNNLTILIDDKEWTFIVHTVNLTEIEMSRVNENTTTSLTLTGPLIVSQLNIWASNRTEEEISSQSNRCIISEEGDVLSWETALLMESFIQIPSSCDDINECDEHPCGNNTCINELGGFTCECSPGYRGKLCEENIDECLTNICQNNSTCVDGVNGYTSTCPPNYKGKFCESLFLNGNWSEWDEWSPCSENCGNGTKTRQRYCTNPAPYNGGKLCTGSDKEIAECIVKDCPVCSPLSAPSNGSLNCSGSPDTGFNCTISCNRGFDFDKGIKPFYECGPNTFFLWDFKSDDNPNGDLPTCNPTKESKELAANFMAFYEDLFCDDGNNKIIKNKMEEVVDVFLEEISCIQKRICNSSDVVILNCGQDSQRKKRAVEERRNTAGFKIKFSCKPIEFGSEVCAEEIVGAINSFQQPFSRDKLAVNISEITYQIDLNQTSARGEIQCEIGFVSTGIHCVPCGVGNFFIDGECKKCDFGFYQDELGQTDCKVCPSSMTTQGRASRDLGSCSVMLILQENYTELYTGVGVSVGTLMLIGALVTVFVFKFRKLELKLGKGSVKVQKKDCQTDAFNFDEQEEQVVALCTIRKLDDNGVPIN